jgi:DNA polymerase zeta
VRWWEEISNRIERGRSANQLNVEEKGKEWEQYVMTTFESIEAIWEKKYKTWEPPKLRSEKGERVAKDVPYSWEGKGVNADEGDALVEVDISMLSDRDITQLDKEESQAQAGQELAMQEQVRGEGDENDEEEDEAYIEEVGRHVDDVEEGQVMEERSATAASHRDKLTFFIVSSKDPFRENSEERQPQTTEYRLSR